MKKFLPGIIGIIVLGLAAFYFFGQNGEPRGGPSPNLTVRRSDMIPDNTIMAAGENQKLISFVLTNHSSTTVFSIDDFSIYPGLLNTFPREKVKNIKVFSGEGTNIAQAPVLGVPALASSTPYYLIPPQTSKSFEIRADIFSTATSSATTTVRIAIGGISARPVSSPTGWREPVYKEIDGRILGRPDQAIDDSIESAIFIFP